MVNAHVTKYIDRFGLVHPEKNKPSENGILFRAQLDLLCKMQSKEYYPGWDAAIYHTIVRANRYQANPPENGDHFSRDNLTGLYAMHAIHGKALRGLAVFKWNDRIWWHPNGWAVYLSYRSKFWAFVLYPIIIAMAFTSLVRGDKEKTSGRCLWFLTLMTLGKNYMWLLDSVEKGWRKEMEPVGESIFFYSYEWYFSGGMRFNNWDQPILEEIKEVF